MKKLMLFVTMASLLSLISITDPLDRIYNENTLSQDLADILAQDTPDSSAYKRINQYLLVMAFSEEQLTDKTYRQLLDQYELWEIQQKIREAKEKAREEQVALDEQRRYERLRKVVELTLTGTEVVYGDSTRTITHQYTLRNRSDKAIRSVEGSLEFNYGLYAYFMRIDVSFAEPMKAHSSRQEQITATFKKSTEEGSKAGENPTGKGTLIWRPEKILLEDGTTLD